MLLAAGLTDINTALSVWTAITFLLLIVVLGRFAWGPILQMVDTREKTIADAIEEAKKERAEAERAAAEMRQSLERARAEAAEREAHGAREEALRLRDQAAAAERDQQDLKTARARLTRIRRRGLVARMLNR